MKKDLFHNTKALDVFDPQTYTANISGIIIDTQGYESLTFFIQSGTILSGIFTPKIEEGDDSGLSDATEVAEANLLGTIAEATFETGVDSNTVKKIGVASKKRYVKLSMLGTSSPDGILGAHAVLGNPHRTLISA